MHDEPRSRILEATLVVVGRYGMAKTTVEDVARAAGVGRATVYRYFPGGRDELIGETITWEVGRFLANLADHVVDAPDFATRLEWALRFAHRAVAEHVVLQKVLETEPERLLPTLTSSAPVVLELLRAYLTPLLADERDRLRPGIEPAAAADWLARNVLSFIVSSGRWDLDDADQVRRLVHEHLLAGVLTAPTGPAAPVPAAEG